MKPPPENPGRYNGMGKVASCRFGQPGHHCPGKAGRRIGLQRREASPFGAQGALVDDGKAHKKNGRRGEQNADDESEGHSHSTRSFAGPIPGPALALPADRTARRARFRKRDKQGVPGACAA